VGVFPKNVGDFPKNVGVFSKNVGDFPKNVGVFSKNVGDFSRNLGGFNQLSDFALQNLEETRGRFENSSLRYGTFIVVRSLSLRLSPHAHKGA